MIERLGRACASIGYPLRIRTASEETRAAFDRMACLSFEGHIAKASHRGVNKARPRKVYADLSSEAHGSRRGGGGDGRALHEGRPGGAGGEGDTGGDSSDSDPESLDFGGGDAALERLLRHTLSVLNRASPTHARRARRRLRRVARVAAILGAPQFRAVCECIASAASRGGREIARFYGECAAGMARALDAGEQNAHGRLECGARAGSAGITLPDARTMLHEVAEEAADAARMSIRRSSCSELRTAEAKRLEAAMVFAAAAATGVANEATLVAQSCGIASACLDANGASAARAAAADATLPLVSACVRMCDGAIAAAEALLAARETPPAARALAGAEAEAACAALETLGEALAKARRACSEEGGSAAALSEALRALDAPARRLSALAQSPGGAPARAPALPPRPTLRCASLEERRERGWAHRAPRAFERPASEVRVAAAAALGVELSPGRGAREGFVYYYNGPILNPHTRVAYRFVGGRSSAEPFAEVPAAPPPS